MMRVGIVELSLVVHIGIGVLLMGCGRSSDGLPTTFITVRVGNLVELYLPSSTSYQRSKCGSRVRFLLKDAQGHNYAFVVVLVKGHNATKFIKLGRQREGWQLKEKSLYQTIDGHRGERLLFQKADRLAEWIYFPLEHNSYGVVIYWYSKTHKYQQDRQFMNTIFKHIKLLKLRNGDHEKGVGQSGLG